MRVVVDDIVVEYTDEGAGPVVLFLHGWKDSLHTFDRISRELSKDFRVIRVDLPGFGHSGEPKDTWQVGNYADLVAHFIGKLGLQVHALVGHSFGGRISIKGIGEGVLSSDKLVLISAAGLARRRTWRNGVLSIIAKIGKALTSIPPLNIRKAELRRWLYGVIGSDYFSAGALKDTFVAVVSEDLTPLAPRIHIPTLIIWGAHDQTTPLEQAHKIHACIQNSRLEVIDTAGHFVHSEEPARVAELIRSFL